MDHIARHNPPPIPPRKITLKTDVSTMSTKDVVTTPEESEGEKSYISVWNTTSKPLLPKRRLRSPNAQASSPPSHSRNRINSFGISPQQLPDSLDFSGYHVISVKSKSEEEFARNQNSEPDTSYLSSKAEGYHRIVPGEQKSPPYDNVFQDNLDQSQCDVHQRFQHRSCSEDVPTNRRYSTFKPEPKPRLSEGTISDDFNSLQNQPELSWSLEANPPSIQQGNNDAKAEYNDDIIDSGEFSDSGFKQSQFSPPRWSCSTPDLLDVEDMTTTNLNRDISKSIEYLSPDELDFTGISMSDIRPPLPKRKEPAMEINIPFSFKSALKRSDLRQSLRKTRLSDMYSKVQKPFKLPPKSREIFKPWVNIYQPQFVADTAAKSGFCQLLEHQKLNTNSSEIDSSDLGSLSVSYEKPLEISQSSSTYDLLQDCVTGLPEIKEDEVAHHTPAISYPKERPDSISYDLNTSTTEHSIIRTISMLPQSQRLGKKSGLLFILDNKSWQKRWVTVDDNELGIYNSNDYKHIIKVIPVTAISLVRNEVKITDSARPNRIYLELVDGRVISMAATDNFEMSVWSNIIMRHVVAKMKLQSPIYRLGGSMSDPDKQGHVRVDDKKRYAVIKGYRMNFYENDNDYFLACVSMDINFKSIIYTVKQLSPTKLQCICHSGSFIITGEDESDTDSWKSAIEESIYCGLSDDSYLKAVQENVTNTYCADCRNNKAVWASVNICVTLCDHCAGLHRKFSISKIHSLRMDKKIWQPNVIALFKHCGNGFLNEIWEVNVPDSAVISPDCSDEQRHDFVHQKYTLRQFMDIPEQYSDNEYLNFMLNDSVKNDKDLKKTMQFVFCGADILAVDNDGLTPLDVARKYGQTLTETFLSLNGGAGNGSKFISINCLLESLEEWNNSVRLHAEGVVYLKEGRHINKRWAILKHNLFEMFNEKGAPNSAIRLCLVMRDHQRDCEGECVAIISGSSNDHNPPSYLLDKYSIEMLNKNGKSLIFIVEDAQENFNWMENLSKSATSPRSWGKEDDMVLAKPIIHAGFLQWKIINSPHWRKDWFILRGKSLFYFDTDKKAYEEIDLRKVTGTSPRNRSEIISDGTHFTMMQYNKVFEMKGMCARDTCAWFDSIVIASTVQGSVFHEQQLTMADIPVYIDVCINHICMNGIQSEGIYRQAGVKSKINRLKEQLLGDARRVAIDQSEYMINDVCGALKQYFRELPEAVTTNALYEQWLVVAGYSDDYMEDKMGWYHYLMNELQLAKPLNYNVLRFLIGHLKDVARFKLQNKMAIYNLATVFAPSLIFHSDDSNTHTSTGDKLSSPDLAGTEMKIRCIEFLITHYKEVFKVSDEDIKKENDLLDAMIRMSTAWLPQFNSREESLFQVEILLFAINGKQTSVHINSRSTANEVLKIIAKREKLNFDDICLHENLNGGDISRPLTNSENVLNVLTEWRFLPTSNNFLIVKGNDIFATINAKFKGVYGIDTTMQYCGSKDAKKFVLVHTCIEDELIKCYRFKDFSKPPLATWPLDSVLVYIYSVAEKRMKLPKGYKHCIALHTINNDNFSLLASKTDEDPFILMAAIHNTKAYGMNAPFTTPAASTHPISIGRISESDDSQMGDAQLNQSSL